MGFNQVVEDSVRGLGFELVECERLAAGLLRVTIDTPWHPGQVETRAVDVDDCERVSHQLQAVFEVEGVDYKRLEVSSPGLDRPLRQLADFERFCGERVELRFKTPQESVGAGSRKTFCGILAKSAQGGWEILWQPEAPAVRKTGLRRAVKAAPVAASVVPFALEDLESARLAPVLDFKRKQARAPGASD